MRFFNRFSLQTPESVELEFTLAGIGNRTYALVIDYIILGLVILVLLLVSVLLYFLSNDILGDLGWTKNKINLWLLAIQIIIVFSIYVSYFVIFETLWQGQTIGKRFVKIRVLSDDGRPIGIQQATLRALLRPIDDLFFIGLFLIMLGKREKRLGDWVAGTIVIQEDRPVNSAIFSVSEDAQSLANKLLIEADISHLLPEDFAVIREYLQRREGMILKARLDLCRTIAEQVKDIILLEEVPEGVTANLFLEAVYLAYQQQS